MSSRTCPNTTLFSPSPYHKNRNIYQGIRSDLPLVMHSICVHYSHTCAPTEALLSTSILLSLHLCLFLSRLSTSWRTIRLHSLRLFYFFRNSCPYEVDITTSSAACYQYTENDTATLTPSAPLPGFPKYPQIHRAPLVRDGAPQLFSRKLRSPDSLSAFLRSHCR